MPPLPDLALAAYAAACVFGAAVVRGYSGFGFSLLTVTALSIAVSPAAIVPVTLMLEVAASVHLLPSIWRQVDWRAIGLLSVGCAVGTPFGVALLAHAPDAPLRLALAAAVLTSAILLARGAALAHRPGKGGTLAAGAASGVMNGAFSMAGPPVVLFFLASPAGAIVGRASIIVYFVATDLYALTLMAGQDLIIVAHLWRAAVFLPILLAGVWAGSHLFRRADPERFRQWVLRLLGLLAILTALQALRAMLD